MPARKKTSKSTTAKSRVKKKTATKKTFHWLLMRKIQRNPVKAFVEQLEYEYQTQNTNICSRKTQKNIQ